jgi:hypothetical protein
MLLAQAVWVELALPFEIGEVIAALICPFFLDCPFPI